MPYGKLSDLPDSFREHLPNPNTPSSFTAIHTSIVGLLTSPRGHEPPAPYGA
jgi:hypothetical protein